MKAIQIHAYGGPEVLQYEDVPKPQPKANEILVRVHAAGVNPVDWKIREGYLSATLPMIMGIDFSGVVESVGAGVTKFRSGDAVFGQVADESGSYAEYTVAMESDVTRKPEGLDNTRAAALPVAGLVPWQALFDIANLTAGQKVLIHGAAGGVGSFAVQFAKWKGARVIGTASGAHVEQVRQLGADEVIDYRKTKFEEVARDVDVVLDTIGGETQERSWQVLKRGGVLVSLVQPPPAEKAAAHGARALFVRQKANGAQLAAIAGAPINPTLITGIDHLNAMVVVPEPSALSFATLALAWLLAPRRTNSKNSVRSDLTIVTWVLEGERKGATPN